MDGKDCIILRTDGVGLRGGKQPSDHRRPGPQSLGNFVCFGKALSRMLHRMIIDVA